jgi:hypothetical protein
MNRGTSRAIAILLCAGGPAWTAGCSAADDPVPASDSPPDPVVSAPAPPFEETRRPGIRFDPDTLRAGDRVGELVLDSARAPDPAMGSDAARAFFRGEIALSGSTMRHPDADAGEFTVCFAPDASNAARMPRWAGDERRIWFCFENQAEAARSLAEPGEAMTATIVIDRYTIYYGMSDEVNAARLAWVVERERGAPAR